MPHTPGPWHVEIDESNPQWPEVHISAGDAGGWTPICHMQANRGCDRRETEANACLIAAAPDLLAACEEWHRIWLYLRDEYQDIEIPHELAPLAAGADACGRLRAAIAKATSPAA